MQKILAEKVNDSFSLDCEKRNDLFLLDFDITLKIYERLVYDDDMLQMIF